MNKRILSLMLSVSMIVSAVGISVSAENEEWLNSDDKVEIMASTSGTCGDNLTWTLDNDGTLTISNAGAMEEFKNAYSVPWYSNRANIKKVVIGDGVTNISDYAFYYCSNLEDITIPDSVTSIGESAYHICDALFV